MSNPEPYEHKLEPGAIGTNYVRKEYNYFDKACPRFVWSSSANKNDLFVQIKGIRLMMTKNLRLIYFKVNRDPATRQKDAHENLVRSQG
jgi:hypothetical protein